MKNKSKILAACIMCIAIVAVIAFVKTQNTKSYKIRITVPAGSKEAFVYSDEEISPTRSEITIAAGKGLGDTEVVLKGVTGKGDAASEEPVYLTPGISINRKAKKGEWYKVGVSIKNATKEDIDLYVIVKHVEVRIE